MDIKEEKQNNISIPRTPWAFFWYVSSPYKKWAFLTIFIVIFTSVLSTGSNYIFKIIVDAVEQGDIEKALFWGLVFPTVLFVTQLLYRVSFFTGGRLLFGSIKTSTDTLNAYLSQHSHGYFVNRFAGSVVNKIRNVVGAIDMTIPDFIWGHLTTFVSFIITFTLIFTVDMYAAFLFFGLIVTLVVINIKLAPKKALLSKLNADASTIVQGRTVDVYSNMLAVRQYVQQSYELKELEVLTLNRKEASAASWIYTEKLLTINVFLVFIFSIGIFYILVNKWGAGGITTGDFILVLVLMASISNTLLFIGRMFNSSARAIGELQEGLDDILVPYEISDIKGAKSLIANNGSVSWNDVSFKFDENYIFRNFNLLIEENQRIGLVGSSGAGKSTFVSLLLRQHEINDGQILIDGQNIATVTQDSLREVISVVPQEPSLFHRTIRENIAYSNPEASLEEVVEVAKQANAHEFIEKLTDGYDTMVGERGVKLSGGQKQRVAIARAMLKNAPILILDEATSALDSESEVMIQQALHKLMEGKTVIAIAHRLSTLREMDRIIVLEDGKIIEDGNHDSLKNNSGIYAKLWNHQSGGFLLD